MARSWLGRRLSGRRLIYFLISLSLLSFVAVQFTFGRPNDVIASRRHPQDGFNDDPPYKAGGPQEARLHADVVKVPPRDGFLNNVADAIKPTFLGKGKFIPEKRIVHLDLKGGAYRPSFFPRLFDFFVKTQFTGILLEWEDMFPYEGTLKTAINGDAYSMQDVRDILQAAKDRKLEVIPLVQTFGHLEWVLKLDGFARLREDPRHPTVICFGKNESFDIIKDMVDQVAGVHKEFGMSSFHMGADEVFILGVCNESVKKMQEHGGKDRAMLWHMSRVAKYIKETHKVDVLAWHDMFAHIIEEDLRTYEMTTLVEPMLWSYAEDLDYFLPFSTWLSLKPFGKAWAASAFKGADGPGRYISNPMHYVKNHESWVKQFDRAKNELKIRGLVYTGWSRYDHMATLCELVPTALPQLLMSQETILEGKPMNGNYEMTRKWLECTPVTGLGEVSYGCKFPGSEVYEVINQYYNKRLAVEKYIAEDYDFNGWLTRIAEVYDVSSPLAVEKIIPVLDQHLSDLKASEKAFRNAMKLIYFQETIDEYVYVYMADIIEKLQRRREAAIKQSTGVNTYPKRPFIKYPKEL
ncbi:unnamed protein product [Bursaphelenchus xylophilus]|uniref:beta-N-acetylhexosaminidase n=1 Tax=Bursaphelenchus xylophilus TaxID=6326 RepID=A0A1I7STZ5_BURXY|nr:unnamed protein product [Bursaphelenchus xylophilus]CAG9107767.1 unnamed protein product [Bursaphelenchus xylophilus]